MPEANKFDGEKVNLSLLPIEAIIQVAHVVEYGAKKYTPHNWRYGMEWSRYSSAALRHLFAWIGGEEKDTESGLPHLAHAACCILFLIAYQFAGSGSDDRHTIDINWDQHWRVPNADKNN